MPKKVDREARKKDIIQAALKVFAKKGVANTLMAEIAEAASIGKGTIYEYFKNKNEIFADSFLLFLDAMDTTMGKRLYKLTDPVQKLKALILGWVEVFDSIGFDYIEVILEFWAEGIRTTHAGSCGIIDLKGLYADFRQMIKAILDEGIKAGKFRELNTTLTASILIGALDGLMLQWILDKSIFSINEAAEHLADEFLIGITI